MSSAEQSSDRKDIHLMPIDDNLMNQTKGQILPLNSAVIQRIRLNIGCNMSLIGSTHEDIEVKKEPETYTCGESVATGLQNAMKQKLADVLQTDNECHHSTDISVVWTKWSALDSDYHKLRQSMGRHKRNKNVICLDSHLFTQFDAQMTQMTQLFDSLKQNKSSDANQSPQQPFIPNKRLKHCL